MKKKSMTAGASSTLLAAFALAAAVALAPAGAWAEELHIYAWSSEMPEEVLNDFTAETGIDVILDTFDSNESMVAKLEAGASGYDVVEPSQYAVQILEKKGLIVPLDHSKLPNLANLGEVFKNVSYDPGNKVSVPYVWGTTGLAYNSDCVKEPVTSWKALWDEKYKGRIYMLDNMLAAYIAGLQVNGFSANTSNGEEVAKATQSLIDQKPLLAGYNSSNFPELVSSGEACLVQAWSGNVLQTMVDNPKVHYVLPEEGGTMWIDGLSVVKDAPNPEAAYKLINYMLKPEVGAKVTQLIKVASSVDGARKLLPPELANNTAVYPSAEALKNADFILDVGEAMKFYQDGWTKVKTAQ